MAGSSTVHPRAVPGPEAYAYPLLLKHILATAVRQSPDTEIVYRDRLRLTYASLDRRVRRLGSLLERLGMGPGKAVGVLDWDSHRYLEAYFAVPGVGAALHTVNVRFTPEQIAYTVNHAQDEVLLVHEDFLPLVEAIWDRLEIKPTVILLSEDGGHPDTAIPIHGEYEALLGEADEDFEFPDFDENTIATIFYTTGTTGLPKGVFFSHRQLFMHTMAMSVVLGTTPEQGRLHRADTYMPLTPMFHVHAWGVPYVSALLGIKQVYPGRYEPEMLVRLIVTEGVTFTHCVPTVLHMLLQATEGKDIDLSGIMMVIGGSALSPGLARAAMDRGIDIMTGYGMSETCPLLSLAQVDPGEAQPEDPDQIDLRTSAGRPIPLVDMRIEPLEGAGDGAGEIVVRAPWLTQGYLGDPEASEQLWRGGYLHTSDIATVGEGGYFRITDRAKDVIKCGGEWLSTIEIEGAISLLPAVAETAVIAVPDGKWGERPCALIVAKEGMACDLDQKRVAAHLGTCCKKGALPRNAILAKVLLVDQLPKTSVGKLDKKLMRQMYSDRA